MRDSLVSPWAEPIEGLAAIRDLWRGDDEPEFTMTSEVVALDDRVAVVRAEVAYAGSTSWRDLWVVRFEDDGRCSHFEEWPFAPRTPDGH